MPRWRVDFIGKVLQTLGAVVTRTQAAEKRDRDSSG
jgi:hypothetical protein